MLDGLVGIGSPKAIASISASVGFLCCLTSTSTSPGVVGACGVAKGCATVGSTVFTTFASTLGDETSTAALAGKSSLNNWLYS